MKKLKSMVPFATVIGDRRRRDTVLSDWDCACGPGDDNCYCPRD